MSVPLWAWAAVLGAIVIMLAIDLFAHRQAHVVGIREAAAWTAVWVTLGLAFGAAVWWVWGAELAAQYYAGYVIENRLRWTTCSCSQSYSAISRCRVSTSTECCSME